MSGRALALALGFGVGGFLLGLGVMARMRPDPLEGQRRSLGARAKWRVGQWNIAPGESIGPDGRRDVVTEASMESFPASDAPAW